MNIEQTIKEIIAEIKNVDIKELSFLLNSNFLEEVNLDSFEVVNFVDRLDTTFKIEFGSLATDFDSLKSWSTLLANIENKINNNNE